MNSKLNDGEQNLKGYKPLAFLDKKLYLYTKGKIWVLNNEKLSEVMDISKLTWKDSNRVFVRLFRREPKFAVPIDQTRMILAMQKKLYLIDVRERTSQVISTARENFSDPLNVCPTKGKWLAIWGDYGVNTGHESVGIYGLKRDLMVEKIASFDSGVIRHIHNIIPKLDGGYYVFTGDREECAGIYACNEDFSSIRPFKIGKQMYRTVVGFDTPQGLLYATDAVNERNYIYLLQRTGEIKVISEINGSCIYGKEQGNGYLFSTTVEPDENNRGPMSWVSRKRGRGILSDEVELVYVNHELKVETLITYKKDIFPMKLMQYGSIQFPHGEGKGLWLYPVAVKKKDGVAVKFGGNRKWEGQ